MSSCRLCGRERVKGRLCRDCERDERHEDSFDDDELPEFVTDGGQIEPLPWCRDCECFAPPTDDGECGECGSNVVLTDGGFHTPHNRQLAGVGDQQPSECPNGSVECARGDTAPCFSCVLDADIETQAVATDGGER